MVRPQNKQFPTVLVLTFLLFPVVAYRWTKRGDGDAGTSWASGPGWSRWANWAHGASRRTGGKRDARGMYHSQQLSEINMHSIMEFCIFFCIYSFIPKS